MGKLNNYRETNQIRLGDYILYCDICGAKTWASECQVMPIETGRGGALVCKDDYDAIDYGIVPYTIRAEEPVPISRNTIPPVGTDITPPFNFDNDDPLDPV